MDTEIRWHGRGGQGVVTASEILAGAVIEENKYVKAFPEFGPERMGAPIRAFTRISDEPIRVHTQIYEPDVVVVIDGTLIGKVDVARGLKKDGIILANYPGSPEDLQKSLGTDAECHTLNATKISIEEIGRPVANTAMLGALVKLRNVVSYDVLESQITKRFSGKLSEKVIKANVSALKRAFNEVV
ncbi:MAG: 2-oxoacid:acceptor oxidoreductase family protein [archaeon]|nr:2-oxoacid:acceptor oxidoreductase family protein [archaeon]